MVNTTCYFGMHPVWWFIWIVVVIWIFATPYDIPGQRNKKNKPLDMLKERFASGHLSNEEYLQKKKILEDEGIS